MSRKRRFEPELEIDGYSLTVSLGHVKILKKKLDDNQFSYLVITPRFKTGLYVTTESNQFEFRKSRYLIDTRRNVAFDMEKFPTSDTTLCLDSPTPTQLAPLMECNYAEWNQDVCKVSKGSTSATCFALGRSKSNATDIDIVTSRKAGRYVTKASKSLVTQSDPTTTRMSDVPPQEPDSTVQNATAPTMESKTRSTMENTLDTVEKKFFTVTFTGHRPDKMSAKKTVTVTLALDKALDRVELDAYTTNKQIRYIVGGCPGFDTLVLESLFRRKTNKAHIELAVPFIGFEKYAGKTHPDENRAAMKLNQSCGVRVVEAGGKQGSFAQQCNARNAYMVKRADFMICYWDGTSGGTCNTVRMAEKKPIPIDNLFGVSSVPASKSSEREPESV